MPPRTRHTDRGMTLVELLVVVAIFVLLAVTVLPAIQATAESRRSREAARMVTSFMTQAHARAIGRREWSGFQLIAAGTSSLAAIDLCPTEVPPVYRGDTVPALLTVSGTDPTRRQASWSGGALQSSSAAGVQANDLIRFGDEACWYELAGTPAAAVSGSVAFRYRGHASGATEDAGNQPHNTPWPPASVPLSFEILRQPSIGGSPLSIPAGRAIDLFWSGFGPPTSALYRRLDVTGGTSPTAGATTSVLFDGTGRLRQILVRNAAGTPTTRLTVTGPLFLLVGRVDRAGQASAVLNAADDSLGANWQYPDSVWIAIDPMTGVVRSAECKPNAVGANDTERLLDSQEWIRQALLMGGN
jgi:prepilin-type N-terminal cleavage/methylation domain-containing protein